LYLDTGTVAVTTMLIHLDAYKFIIVAEEIISLLVVKKFMMNVDIIMRERLVLQFVKTASKDLIQKVAKRGVGIAKLSIHVIQKGAPKYPTVSPIEFILKKEVFII
jgi:hypothetical protein